MLDAIKNAINLDAHLYHLDPSTIKKIYNKENKILREYQIVEKRILFSKDDRYFNNFNTNEYSLTLTKEQLENKYYSNFDFFREYLMNPFEDKEISLELKETKELIDHSKNLRKNLEKYFEIENLHNEFDNNDRFDNDMQQQSDTKLTASIGGGSSIFTKTKFMNNFLKMCKLLTLKSEDNTNKFNKIKKFKVYSELTEPSDIFSFSLNENLLKTNLLNYQKKLTASAHLENYLESYATNYKKSNKNFEIPLEIKIKSKVEYVDSIFSIRENDFKIKLDAFFSKHVLSKKTYRHEKELYENMYSLLLNKNESFLSYLYSKDALFKFIFNQFASSKSFNNFNNENNNLMNSLEKLSRIDSIETDKFFKGSLSISPKRRQTLRLTTPIDELIGHYYFDKISFLPDKIDDVIVEQILKDELSAGSNSNLGPSYSNNLNSINVNYAGLNDPTGLIFNYLKTLENLNLNFLFLITKNETLKIINNNFSDDMNLHKSLINDINEELRKIRIFKLEKQSIIDKVKAKDLQSELFINSCYYILEIKANYPNRRQSDASHKISFSVRTTSEISDYFLFRILSESAERFDMNLNYLKLFSPLDERKGKNSNINKIKYFIYIKIYIFFREIEKNKTSSLNSMYDVKITEEKKVFL